MHGNSRTLNFNFRRTIENIIFLELLLKIYMKNKIITQTQNFTSIILNKNV